MRGLGPSLEWQATNLCSNCVWHETQTKMFNYRSIFTASAIDMRMSIILFTSWLDNSIFTRKLHLFFVYFLDFQDTILKKSNILKISSIRASMVKVPQY